MICGTTWPCKVCGESVLLQSWGSNNIKNEEEEKRVKKKCKKKNKKISPTCAYFLYGAIK